MPVLESSDSALTYDNFVALPIVIEGEPETAVVHEGVHEEEGRSIDYTEEFGDRRMADECRMEDGRIYFGVSPPGKRSPLDEHAWFEGQTYLPRRTNESCISLTVKYLKAKDRNSGKVFPITAFPAIQREVNHLHTNDLTVVEDDYHMESFQYAVKAMHAWRPNDPDFVRRWLREGMNVKRDCAWGSNNFTFPHAYILMGQVTEFAKRGRPWRRDWLEAGLEAVEHAQRRFRSACDALRPQIEDQSVLLQSPLGEKIKFAWVESDNERMGSAARHIGCNMLLQVNPDGHMQVYTDYRVHNGKGINLNTVAYHVHLAEQKARVKAGLMQAISTEERTDLVREGFPYWGAVWYYIYGMLLNGSLTRRKVPITCLNPRQLFELIQRALFADGYTTVR